MTREFITEILNDNDSVTNVDWKSECIIEISRKKYPPFRAAILQKKIVTRDEIEPFTRKNLSVIANFPKIGKWAGDAIDLCENNNIAWGQWGVLLRAIGTENPETTKNPEIFFNRRALSQHSRVNNVKFIFDHLLLIEHDSGKELKIALLYQYDLCGDDVRTAWEDMGPFHILLKTNPNGSILADARDVATELGTLVLGLKGTLSFLARGRF